MRRRGKLISMGIALLALGLAVGAAAVERVETSLVFHELTPNRASGTLSAKEKECKAKRTVLLYAIRGKRQDFVEKDISSEKGSWEIRESLVSGRYEAIVQEDRRGEFICRRAEKQAFLD